MGELLATGDMTSTGDHSPALGSPEAGAYKLHCPPSVSLTPVAFM
jgi:hypothetical protein